MKKTMENRYPHSATLFRFCKEALEIRYNRNVKVIDQDVGAILGYDPADCSHWKKGKKNIRGLATLKSIAEHLHIDERLLIDIASGKMDLEEAVYEFRGYGGFNLQGKQLEGLKKEYFRNPSKWQPDGGFRSFEELFDVNRKAVVEAANSLLAAGNFLEAPVYIPEVYQLFPDVRLEFSADQIEPIEVTHHENAQVLTTVKFRGPDMKPYIRFLLAKQLYLHLIETNNPMVQKLVHSPKEISEIQGNIFAGVLLVPSAMIKREMSRIDYTVDLVTQLTDTFWVSKILMNQRLRDFMENMS